MQHKRENQKGFNLVELLVVMAIIAVLVGILIYTINAARMQQRNTQRRSIINTAKSALESYYAKCKTYPNSPAGGSVNTLLTTAPAAPCTGGGGGVSTFVPGLDAASNSDPAGQNTRLCYFRRSRTQYWLYTVTEPTAAPGACTNADPVGVAGAEDFSVR